MNNAIRFYLREDAEAAVRFINGTRLDDRIIRYKQAHGSSCGDCWNDHMYYPRYKVLLQQINSRTDWDAGFVEGRQYGRGKTGGQV